MCLCSVWIFLSTVRYKPVFLKGKSSLLSMGDDRVYWQVGDVPPRGGELWSSDVWWEDLIIHTMSKLPLSTSCIIKHMIYLNLFVILFHLMMYIQLKKQGNTYMYQSFGCWMKPWLAPLLPGSLADLFNRNSWSFCLTSVLATAPVRPADTNSRIGVTLG